MRLVALVALTMAAFSANSLLNRVALTDGIAGPASFAVVRVVSGALVLWLISARLGQGVRLAEPRRVVPALALTLYLLGFSLAYLTVDAGIGALVLFGFVQVTMFAGALIAGDRLPVRRWIGMALGLIGLVLLVWPSDAVAGIDPLGAALMAAAAFGWGIYSLKGRASDRPIADTATSFLLATPIVVVAWGLSGEGFALSLAGVALAVFSGVVTSGMGYALWYSVLPRLDASVAALAQLTVPVIAMAGGIAFLSESIDLKSVLSALLVLGGVAVGIVGSNRRSAREDRS